MISDCEEECDLISPYHRTLHRYQCTTPNATLHTEGYPAPPDIPILTWSITVRYDEYIELTVLDLYLTNDTSCQFNYLQILTRSNTGKLREIDTICQTGNRTITYLSDFNYLYVFIIISDHYHASRGFLARYQSHQFPYVTSGVADDHLEPPADQGDQSQSTENPRDQSYSTANQDDQPHTTANQDDESQSSANQGDQRSTNQGDERPANQSECLEGWIPFQSSCYDVFSVTSLTWLESEAACVKEGGHLVSINDMAEMDFIYSLVIKAVDSSPYTYIG